MRIIVISDTHGKATAALDFLQTLGQYDTLVHLGDGANDIANIRKFINADIITIKGNNDFQQFPLCEKLQVADFNILCCHGHTFGVKASLSELAAEAVKANCTVALYGHTHIMSDTSHNGVRMINPGSIGYPYGPYGAVEIIDGADGTIIRLLKAVK